MAGHSGHRDIRLRGGGRCSSDVRTWKDSSAGIDQCTSPYGPCLEVTAVCVPHWYQVVPPVFVNSRIGPSGGQT